MAPEKDNQEQSGDEWIGLLSTDGYWQWDGEQWRPVKQEEDSNQNLPPTSEETPASRSVPEWRPPWATSPDPQNNVSSSLPPLAPSEPSDAIPTITRAALFGKKNAERPSAERLPREEVAERNANPEPSLPPAMPPASPPAISPSVPPPSWEPSHQAAEQELIPWSRPEEPTPLSIPPEHLEEALIPSPSSLRNSGSALQSIPTPDSGIRRLIYKLTGGYINLGPSIEDQRRRQLLFLIRTRVNGCRRIAVISRKGGIGKTTTSLMLGHQFASARSDRVIALDANPDAGSLGDRVVRETDATVTDILREGEHLIAYSDIRRFTSQAPSRLEVVASDNDPSITEALGAQDYSSVMDVLSRHYSLIICDTGTGILDSATRGILDMADQVVLCAAPSLDASRVSASTLDWLEKHGYGQLARDAVVAINAVRPGGPVEVDKLQKFFERRCRAVTRIPWDIRLAAGAETTLEELHPATRAAYLQLAAMVAAGFVRNDGRLS